MKYKYELTGRVVSVGLGLDPDSLVTTRQESVQAVFGGFAGDKHAGITRPSDSRTPQYPRGTEIRNDRQVSLVSVEELEQVAAALGVSQVLPEWLGANLCMQHIPRFSRLPPGTRLVFPGNAVLVVEQENNPCVWPGKILSSQYGDSRLTTRFPKLAMHLRGVVGVVEKPGPICAGDEVKVLIPQQVIYRM